MKPQSVGQPGSLDGVFAAIRELLEQALRLADGAELNVCAIKIEEALDHLPDPSQGKHELGQRK